jgi:hypothetical protein
VVPTLGELSYGPHANALPLCTANPDDFRVSEGRVEIVAVRGRPNDL